MKEKKYCELIELKRLLKRKNYSYRRFAKTISISTDSLNNKLNGYSYFNVNEANRIVSVLGIDTNDIGIYFFPVYCVTQQSVSEKFNFINDKEYRII